MKRIFSLDLNTWQFAATLTDEKGNTDYSSQQLLVALIKHCNPILVPHGYYNVYIRIISNLKARKEYFDPNIWSLWNQLVSIEGKFSWPFDEVAVLLEEGQFHDKDKDFVRLLAHVNSGTVFATTDNKLIIALSGLGLTQKYGFEILRPEEALKRVHDDLL